MFRNITKDVLVIATSIRRSKDIDKYVVKPLLDILEAMPEKGFESREGQESMALDIAEAIRDGDNLMVEAGVGIGKSFGYLLPALLLKRFMSNHRFQERPVIVATSSIQLSEQLLGDAIKAARIIGIPVSPVVGKGRGNFTCLERATTSDISVSRQDELFSNLINWVMENKTGDRSDLPFPVPDHLWNRVNVDRCNFEYCYSRFECHYYNNRRDISDQTSHDIIIVNQDYLIAHLLKLHKTGKPPVMIKGKNLLQPELAKSFMQTTMTNAEMESLFSTIKGIKQNIVTRVNSL